jgi:dihydrofolate reductase
MIMTVRVNGISVSLDGYAAGPDQDRDNPLGVGGERLHEWAIATRTFHEMNGEEGGSEGIDDQFAAGLRTGIGATIMGRNMFGPIRGEWGDEEWNGWWGDNPPYHNDVFVLTNHARKPAVMEGGTTFNFVTDGIESALERAREAAGDQDVLIAGGASTIRQYLRAGLIDQMHLAFVPMLLGGGERVFDQPGDADRYECVGFVPTDAAIHARFARTSAR